MTPCAIHETMTLAEKACTNAIGRYLPDGVPIFRFEPPGRADCAVFSIGAPMFGDLFAAHLKSLPFQGRLTIYMRDHDKLQETIMHMISHFPVNADLSADDELRENSNVILLRVSPGGTPISAIRREEVETRSGVITTCAVDISFDVVFAVRFE